jgi:hypothetical protein
MLAMNDVPHVAVATWLVDESKAVTVEAAVLKRLQAVLTVRPDAVHLTRF